MKPVTKRKIFYIPGFDPRSEVYYKKLLLQNFPEVKENIIFQDKKQIVFDRSSLQVDYEILSWHEAVKAYWGSGAWVNIKNVFTLFNEYVFKGAYFRLYQQLSKRDAIQKAFSVYFFLVWMLIFIGVGSVLVNMFLVQGLSFFVILLSLLFGLGNLLVYKALDKLNVFWVTRIMNFFVLYANQKVPKVLEKEAEFKAKILEALESQEYDEVVLVAHSVGTILATHILSELAQQAKDAGLKVVTLGHCVSAVSMVKNSEWFNQELFQLANRNFYWIDVTAGKDAVAFYKVNPALHKKSQPNVTFSAGFHKIFNKAFYKTIKWNFYKVHFLYLYKPDMPDKNIFNYEKLLLDPKLFKKIKAGNQ